MQINRYTVDMLVSNQDHQTKTIQVEICAYNKRQAEKKAINGNSNRNTRMLSCKAVLIK